MSEPYPPPLSPSTAAIMPEVYEIRSGAHSKKRGRSPERRASDGERTSRDKRFASRASTQGEQLAGELGLTRLKARGVEVTQEELFAQIGPMTQVDLFGLLAACRLSNEELSSEQPLDLDALAAVTRRPETMSAHHLLEIVQWAVHAREFPLAPDKEDESLAKLQRMGAEGVKVLLDDLAKKADDDVLVAFMSFAERVGNAYDVYRDAPFAVDRLAAETGPGTMPASQLLELVESVRFESTRAASPPAAAPAPQREVKIIDDRKKIIIGDATCDASLFDEPVNLNPYGVYGRWGGFIEEMERRAAQELRENLASMARDKAEFEAFIRAMPRASRR